MESGAARHALLGYHRPREAMLGPDEEILLLLDQAPGVPYDFVDAAVVHVLLGEGALATRDFGAARPVEGSAIGHQPHVGADAAEVVGLVQHSVIGEPPRQPAGGAVLEVLGAHPRSDARARRSARPAASRWAVCKSG